MFPWTIRSPHVVHKSSEGGRIQRVVLRNHERNVIDTTHEGQIHMIYDLRRGILWARRCSFRLHIMSKCFWMSRSRCAWSVVRSFASANSSNGCHTSVVSQMSETQEISQSQRNTSFEHTIRVKNKPITISYGVVAKRRTSTSDVARDLTGPRQYRLRTGHVVWDCARVAASFLEKLDTPSSDCVENVSFWTGKRVLELGSGTGFLGIVAATLGNISLCVVSWCDLSKHLSRQSSSNCILGLEVLG